MKIVVLDGYTLNPGDLNWNGIQQLGELTVYDRTAAVDVISRSKGAEVLLTNKVVLTRDIMNALHGLRYISVLATGYNVVDMMAARDRNIVVTNIPSYSTESVVQSTFAHLLNMVSRISECNSSVKKGDWVNCIDFSYWPGPLVEINGKTLGIVGYGTIGRRVAQVARAFGMEVLVYGPHLSLGELEKGIKAVSLESLLSKSDVITLHCALTDATKNLIDRKRIMAMKNGAFIINTGRGPLLDETAVADALVSGKLAGVGVDVLSTEPPQKDNPLLSAPNCYITPHNAWATQEARHRLIRIAEENLRAFLAGKPQNVVH